MDTLTQMLMWVTLYVRSKLEAVYGVPLDNLKTSPVFFDQWVKDWTMPPAQTVLTGSEPSLCPESSVRDLDQKEVAAQIFFH